MAEEPEENEPEQTGLDKPGIAAEPEWARALKQSIEELPGKLVASVTDDDKSGIAEAVHGLFESSGAFAKGDEPPPPEEKEIEKSDNPNVETPPKKSKGLQWFASRFEGEG
jgi:hypothetical protein